MSLEDARIRLEGRLEIIEATTAALHVASKRLDTDAAPPVVTVLAQQNAPELTEAEFAARLLMPSEPTLEPVLQALARARKLFEDAVTKRLKCLELAPFPLEMGVKAIDEEPIRYRGTLWSISATRFLAFVPFVLAARPLGWAPYVIACLAAAMAWSTARDRVKAIVTSKRLVLGERAFVLSNVETIRVEPLPMQFRRRQQFEATLAFRDGASFETQLPSLPMRLLETLSREGVTLKGAAVPSKYKSPLAALQSAPIDEPQREQQPHDERDRGSSFSRRNSRFPER